MFPQEFIRRTRDLLPDEYDAFETALTSPPPVSLRLNPQQALPVFKSCGGAGAGAAGGGAGAGAAGAGAASGAGDYEKIPWCGSGYYLTERPQFTFDPLFHAGAYYVQEASSMFLEQAFAKVMAGAETRRMVVLDLCAAPGGKSTHLLSLLPEGGLLVSNEVIRSRSLILVENIAKWGRADCIVTRNAPEDFGKLKQAFDVILADLPCSGEGLFRRDPAACGEWSVEGVKLCAARQRRIVRDVWDALRAGGWLIYCTCTFNTEENEENVARLANELDAEIIPVDVKPEWNIAGSLRHGIPACRFFPHRTRGEGFFLSLLQKRRLAPATSKDVSPKTAVLPKAAAIKRLFATPDQFRFFAAGSRIYALPEVHAAVYAGYAQRLNILSAGIHAGEWKGTDFIPSASLALSAEMHPDAFPAIELAYEEAISYLRKEAIRLPADAPKGYLLATYQHVPLGFMKNIGSRANNLYPPEWRIRKRF